MFHASSDGLNFSHQKLSSLRVVVVDAVRKESCAHFQKEQPVSAALLSLSSDGFNSNQATRADGSLVFGELFPGDYFLQAQLKEYRFEQPTQTVSIPEGSAVELTLRCTRVAFSVFGRVTTITGQPQSKLRVIAVADKHKEVAFTDAQGVFRVRGLRPGVAYQVTVAGVEHLLPAELKVEVADRDVTDASFVVLTVPSAAVGERECCDA